jgi:hypothetical protein
MNVLAASRPIRDLKATVRLPNSGRPVLTAARPPRLPLAARHGAAIETCTNGRRPGRPIRNWQDLDDDMTGSTTYRIVPSRLVLQFGVAALAAMALAGCGGKDRPKADLAASRVTTIGVNGYLWRASLDALSFMPLLQTDSNGGVIVTDWYANPRNPNERVKVTVTILDQDLRADALRVAASRQVNSANGWVEAPVSAATVQRLEDIILTKARDLRRGAIAG